MKLSPKLNLPIPEGSDIHNLTNFVALLNAIDNNSAPLGTMNNHINNKNNPHAVTKAQVGLDQVNNVPQYSKTEMDSKLSDLSKLTQLPANSVPSTSTPASFPIGITVMTVTSGDYPGVTTNSPGTLMTVRGSNDRGVYQLLSGNGTPQQRTYDGAAWGGWSTVATTASNVASASKLANTRKIGGVNFDGTSDITLPGVNAPGNQSTSGKAATAGRADEATHADNATSANKLTTARKIGGVTFDGSADIALPGVNTASNQDTSGRAATAGRADAATHADNADTATKLTTTRKIGGVNFDGTSDITLPGVNAPGNQNTSGNAQSATWADTAVRATRADYMEYSGTDGLGYAISDVKSAAIGVAIRTFRTVNRKNTQDDRYLPADFDKTQAGWGYVTANNMTYDTPITDISNTPCAIELYATDGHHWSGIQRDEYGTIEWHKVNEAVINIISQADYDALADKSGVYFIEG